MRLRTIGRRSECWLAGEPIQRPSKAIYKKSTVAKSVVVTFADGETVRVSTYLDGQAGLNEAGRFARSSKQSAPLSKVERLRLRAGGKLPAPDQWVKDAGGVWRCVPTLRDVPDIAAVEYADDCLLRSSEAA